MLILPIKKKWFDMILSGEKKEESREIKSYYQSRLNDMVQTGYHTIRLRNGYSSKSPIIECDVEVRIDYGKEKWGAEPNTLYYVIEIIEILDVENVKESDLKCHLHTEE